MAILNPYYVRCCEQRLADLVKYVAMVYPGQTITGEYVINNARLKDIAKGSASTQRIIDSCKRRLNEI